MRRQFDPDTAATVAELTQLLYDFGYEIDANQGRAITDYYAEDGVWELGDRTLAGHDALRDFYAAHYARVRAEQRDGQRQVLHAFVNPRVSVTEDRRSAVIEVFNLNFSAEGARPAAGPIQPNMVVECRMELRREDDGLWRIVRFSGAPQFTGGQAFVETLVVRGA